MRAGFIAIHISRTGLNRRIQVKASTTGKIIPSVRPHRRRTPSLRIPGSASSYALGDFRRS
jgi:hypothetical protein